MNFFGKKLPWSTKRDVLSVSARNLIIARLNPLQEIAVRWGNKNQVTYSDENVVIELDSSMAGSGGGGGGGAGVTQITSLDASVKLNPVFGTGVVDLSVRASKKRKLFIVQAFADYLQCADPVTSADVFVAKPPLLRFSTQTSRVNWDGNQISYSSYDIPSQTRSAGGTNFGGLITEVINPTYRGGDVIYADGVDVSDVSVSGTALTLIDSNVDGRKWVMSYGL